MLQTLSAQIGVAIFIAVIGLVLWKGDRPERWAAGALLTALVVNILVQDRNNWMDPEHRFLVVDLVLFAVFLRLAVVYGRAWLMIATAFELLSMLTHLAVILHLGIGPVAYLTVTVGFSYGVLASLAFGGWQAHERRKRARPSRGPLARRP